MTDDKVQILIGAAALIVAILTLLAGSAIVKRRRVRQDQRVGKGAVGIQSGRDTKVDRIK